MRVSVWLLTVVCGEAVDDVQVLPQSLHVLARPQHGSDLRSPVTDLLHVVLAQEEVMGRHLACDLDALLLRRSDDEDLRKKSQKFHNAAKHHNKHARKPLEKTLNYKTNTNILLFFDVALQISAFDLYNRNKAKAPDE